MTSCDMQAFLQMKTLWRLSMRLFWAIVMVLGLTTLFTLAYDNIAFFVSSHEDTLNNPKHRPSLFTNYFTHGVTPVPCHSHNDYWRRVPLFSALRAGCTSVEADIWLENDILRVGHTPHTILRGQTLNSLYLNPLLETLQQHNPHLNGSVPVSTSAPASASESSPAVSPASDQPSDLTTTYTNAHTHTHSPKEIIGIFPTNPTQTLVLLIDFKSGEHQWEYLMEALRPLRESGYLSYTSTSTSTSKNANSSSSTTEETEIITRPITIVATGSAPYHRILSNPHRDTFYDAPLDDLDSTPQSSIHEAYSWKNSYYASVNFHRSIGSLPLARLSQGQLAKARSQIQAAHERGLKVRYWGTPGWPVGLRNYVWRVLVREGVDVLNVDDLRAATRVDWGRDSWW
ncbi:hypothetical protein N7533_000439 [Penicillium manginii]|uniref:uncharacterized protein n=1 Tax=Penicillium manginii TaxID=203109 RepID=UPI0025486513|nr:uncharacterized protein N7533_000439 [Penicillium manginii]KAJ5767856.1 hypothetical protein N7533_000439 [Penicillium manginii]